VRFAKERLWHVEITLAEPAAGPLILGDGRYLGLGLMEPISDNWRDLIVLELAENTRVGVDYRTPFLQAVRRALMALARRGDGTVPRLFSGHEIDDTPARSGRQFEALCFHRGLAVFRFNHFEPKAPTAKVRAESECAYCHMAGAKKD
jgi:hypothetical protein